MYLTLIFLPLLGAISAGFFGRFLGPKGSFYATTVGLASSAILSVLRLWYIRSTDTVRYFLTVNWIESDLWKVDWNFYFDSLRCIICVIVTSISTLVHLYRGSYIEGDPHLPRFISYLSLFTFFILILVTAGNFLQLFVGWEGVGVCSYLLINFWYTRRQANKAAIKAMLVNRVRDVFVVLALIVLYREWGRLNFSIIFARTPLAVNSIVQYVNLPVIDVVCFLLFFGAIGKSAQLFLHTWLPDAIEGPTPVRSLIHAATIVTAGVFLLIRTSPLLEYRPIALSFISIIGIITRVVAGTIGMQQYDLKRVIAYSTCSQLGYIVFRCGMSAYPMAAYHLRNHAFFKALLFIGAGAVIHAISDEQDIRRIGGLAKVMPYTYAVIVVGRLSLIGFPGLTGFYSKDLIIESRALYSYSLPINVVFALGRLATACTRFYRIRALYLTFLAPTSSYKVIIQLAHDPPLKIRIPLALLSFGAIAVGYLTEDLFVGEGTYFWGNSIYVVDSHRIILENEWVPIRLQMVPMIIRAFGTFIALYLYSRNRKELYHWKQQGMVRNSFIRLYLNRKWAFDNFYNSQLNQKVVHYGYRQPYVLLDRGLFEIIGPFGFSTWVYKKAYNLQKIQSGNIGHYARLILLGIIFVLRVLLSLFI